MAITAVGEVYLPVFGTSFRLRRHRADVPSLTDRIGYRLFFLPGYWDVFSKLAR
jgi:hypothetical protein